VTVSSPIIDSPPQHFNPHSDHLHKKASTRKGLSPNQKKIPGRGGIIPFVLPDLQLNDHLRLRKPHPCGSYEWTVVRLGADIGLECKGCGHRVMLTRRELAKRMKTNLTKLAQADHQSES
jgi:hypothetical protein